MSRAASKPPAPSMRVSWSRTFRSNVSKVVASELHAAGAVLLARRSPGRHGVRSIWTMMGLSVPGRSDTFRRAPADPADRRCESSRAART